MEKPREIPLKLKKLRERAGLSMAEVAKAAGYKAASSYQRYEDPDLYKKETLPLPLARKLADILAGKGSPPVRREEILMLAGISELSPNQLLSLDQHQVIWCIGEAQAGVWLPRIEWERDRWLPFLISFVDDRYPDAQRFALCVRGDSVDEIYPDGSYVVFVKFTDISRRPQHGDRVIVHRKRDGKTEVSVKEYRRDSNKRAWLVPRSSNPSHQSIVVEKHSDHEIDIYGLIVGSQRVE